MMISAYEGAKRQRRGSGDEEIMMKKRHHALRLLQRACPAR